MKKLLLTGVALWAALPGLYAQNLLTGDPGVETEYKNMTNGTWSNRMIFARKQAFWDDQNAWEGKRSIRAVTPVGLSIYETGRLPKGEYVFSFYAKANRDGVKAHINCTEFNRKTWPTRLPRRKIITLNRKWQRYTYVFKADGVNY